MGTGRQVVPSGRGGDNVPPEFVTIYSILGDIPKGVEE